MRGDCSANRPNSGVAVGAQFEGNRCVEEVDVLCEGAVNVYKVECGTWHASGVEMRLR